MSLSLAMMFKKEKLGPLLKGVLANGCIWVAVDKFPYLASLSEDSPRLMSSDLQGF